MVRYEVAMVLRPVGEKFLEKMLKDVARTILQEGGIIRKLTNCGERKLPRPLRAHKKEFDRGRYFFCDMEAGPTMVDKMLERLVADDRVVRCNVFKLHKRDLYDRGEMPPNIKEIGTATV